MSEGVLPPVNPKRAIHLQLIFTTFDLPPLQDVLIVGRGAPVGPEAVRRMADAIAPDQYVVEALDHPDIEAIAVRKELISVLPIDQLRSIVLEEAARLAPQGRAFKVAAHLEVSVFRVVSMG